MNTTECSVADPFSVHLDFDTGALAGAEQHLLRRASDMRGYYSNHNALEDLIVRQNDPVHYEVIEARVPLANGHLMFCISKLQPGLVGDEYFMTKGHYHAMPGTAELYLCLRGRGYIIMKTEQGAFAAEELFRGRIVYVPPFWAHRSVNTCLHEPLVSLCIYPAEAGHNYGDIALQGFPKRLYHRNGVCVIE